MRCAQDRTAAPLVEAYTAEGDIINNEVLALAPAALGRAAAPVALGEHHAIANPDAPRGFGGFFNFGAKIEAHKQYVPRLQEQIFMRAATALGQPPELP